MLKLEQTKELNFESICNDNKETRSSEINYIREIIAKSAKVSKIKSFYIGYREGH